MAEYDLLVESIELALLSNIESSSALMMKNAYLPDSPQQPEKESCDLPSQPVTSRNDGGLSGPNALVYVTKLTNRIPEQEIRQVLTSLPDRIVPANHDFYMVVLIISMGLGDSSTTRFINGTIGLVFPRGMKILAFSPNDKGTIAGIIKNGEPAIAITRDLEFLPSAAQSTKRPVDPVKKMFEIRVGPCENTSGTFSKKNGYELDISPRVLLEYRGMLKNDHEMFWEMYPPMPPQDTEISGDKMLVVFSLIVQAPKNTLPKITAQIEGRVKGNLWGVIPIKGSAVL